MPPKPPLLMHTTWSPGRAAWVIWLPAWQCRGPFGALAWAHPAGPGRQRRPSPAGGGGKTPGRRAPAPRAAGFHGAQFHGVAAGLKHRQDAPWFPAAGRRPSSVVRSAVGGGQSRRTRQCRAPCRAAPCGASRSGTGPARQPPRRVPPHVVGSGNGGQGIELVVHACQRHSTARHLAALGAAHQRLVDHPRR